MYMKIKIFWWSKIKFQNAPQENYGDLLSKYLVEKISNKDASWVNPRKIKWWSLYKKHFFIIGSILSNINKHSIVWGSGIISKNDNFPNATFLAVRGPQTRKRIIDLGYKCPEVYGDPGILLPKFFNPLVEKKYELGIIAHYVDNDFVNSLYKNVERVKVINLLTNDIEQTTKEILECKRIVSSSLHGVIVSQSYNIPSVWVKFSDKLFGDNVKFSDYFSSVNLEEYQPELISDFVCVDDLIDRVEKNKSKVVSNEKLEELQIKLLNVCPF